jgi:hypothetical protein
VSHPTNCVLLGGCDVDGGATGLAVSGNLAYITQYDSDAGLKIIDLSHPSNCVLVGSHGLPTYATGLALSGSRAYVTDRDEGLHAIDVSDPVNPVLVGIHHTGEGVLSVTVVAERIYLTSWTTCLTVLPTLPNVQFSVRVEATTGVPFTLEAATNLSDPNSWQPLLTTNVATMPFDFVDFDVKLADKPRKFYRVRQP